MTGDLAETARAALQASRHSIAHAADHCPDAPGLYAVWGSEEAWQQLRLQLADGPLYFGKAEDSLVRRDLRTHFKTGTTGSSTLRRSLAALLRDDLQLVAMPRNPLRPGHFSNFALEPEGDARLTQWMHSRLALAFWPKAQGCDLNDVETGVLSAWRPPLNLSKIKGADPQLRTARRRMADAARSWCLSS